MTEHSTESLAHQVRRITRVELGAPELPFAHVLPPEQVRQALERHGVHTRACVLEPVVTLYGFLAQVLDADPSCRQAAANLRAALLAQDQEPCSARNDAYCKARKRLPEQVLADLALGVGLQLHASRRADPTLLGGRPIKIVDGTEVSMPDTPANQQAYPQPQSQAQGLGFPMARLVALMALTSGAMLALATGPYAGKQTGETALFRQLYRHLDAGDVLLGDRYYCSYWVIAELAARGVDVVLRLHQSRRADFRRGQRLGQNDRLVIWYKPKKRPAWMDKPAYQAMPAQIRMRLARVQVTTPGARVQSLVLATTLRDPARYPRQELAKAFRARWHAELDLRSIKVALHMDTLRCKSPAMVRKEIWMHLLAYNLVRSVMARAATLVDLPPRQLSFTGAVQTLLAFAPRLPLLPPAQRQACGQQILRAIACHRVGNRPDRVEPRAVKRRPTQPLLTVPRATARKHLLCTG